MNVNRVLHDFVYILFNYVAGSFTIVLAALPLLIFLYTVRYTLFVQFWVAQAYCSFVLSGRQSALSIPLKSQSPLLLLSYMSLQVCCVHLFVFFFFPERLFF